MFARILESTIKHDQKDDLIETMRREVLPILKKQHGFLEFLPLIPENQKDKAFAITLWTEKSETEKYAKEVFPRIEAIVKPFLTAPIVVRMFNVETTLCEHLVEMLTAAA
ncbi:MAG: hypothetical protein WB510_10530 [Candidatus Sulfotelmatobacter sp.]